ncbi:MAG: response regulator [Desulfobacterales bacterium]|nr:response regulator [Desulfobacterales bacterium]
MVYSLNDSEKGSLLIVDDESEVLKSIKRYFRNKYIIYTANSGDEGYKTISSQPVHIIICDQRMPGMSGTEFFKKIKNTFPYTIRIILTGYSDIQAVISAINEGNVFRYVAKPWDPIELDAIIKDAFERYWLTINNLILMKELKIANETLEERVKARTAELTKINETLKFEIEERKRIEADLQASKQELFFAKNEADAANKAKSEFLAKMSHEIRTPMNAVIGMTDILLNVTNTEPQLKYLNIIKTSADNLIAIINDILDISKIESGKMRLEKINFNLNFVVDEISKILEITANKKGINFSYSINNDVPIFLKGDPFRLKQILLNLTGNAIKFTEKGNVEILVSNYDRNSPNATIKFIVKDTGIGIPKDRLNLLFKLFSQVDSSINRNYSGTGLGLAISKQLVELMNGKIGVETEEGHGSCFWFIAIFEKQSEEDSVKCCFPNDNNKELNPIDLFSLKILLVEDNFFNQEVIIGFLNNSSITIAGNGKEALNLLRDKIFDLILMDVQLPDMDGLEITEIIRNKKSDVLNHDIPIIAVTANASREDIQNCLEAGMNEYISKPIRYQKLFEAINKVLKK